MRDAVNYLKCGVLTLPSVFAPIKLATVGLIVAADRWSKRFVNNLITWGQQKMPLHLHRIRDLAFFKCKYGRLTYNAIAIELACILFAESYTANFNFQNPTHICCKFIQKIHTT